MRYIKFAGVIIFTLVFVSGCRKDWGNAKGDIYSPLDGPPEDVKYDPNNYEISFDINPSPMKIDREAVLSVNVSRKDKKDIDFNIYYDWTIVNDASYYSGSYYFSLEVSFHPRINNVLNVQGYSIKSVTVSASVTDALVFFGSTEAVRSAVSEIGMLLINLQLGYENNNNEIEFFYSSQASIPVYY